MRNFTRWNRLCLLMLCLLGWLSIWMLSPDPYCYSATVTYYVQEGETLWSIADDFSISAHDIRKVVDEIQELSDCDSIIYVGQKLTVPLYNNMRGE